MKTITVLGNNSGRNAGDNAILGNLLDDFALRRSDIHFKIPTLSTSFINNAFGKHPITPMGMLPWNLAMKNLGLPMLRAMTQTNLVLITDNILFDRKFHNPFVNNLNAISLFAPLCKKKNIPIVFYNCSIGPIERKVGINALQKVLNASPLVITRDPTTEALLHRLPLTHPEIKVHADCALNTPIPSDERMNEIIQKEGLFTNSAGTIGMNVNAYIDDFNETGSFDRETFCKIIAGTADKLIETLGVDILFTVSQIMDMKITKECLAFSKHQDCIKVVGNCDYTYEELTGLLSKVEIHAGLRTHTLIFCAAVGTPMVNINAYPKSDGFLKTLGMGDWTIQFDGLTVDSLTDMMTRSFENRVELKAQLIPVAEKEKQKSRDSVDDVCRILDGLV